MAKITILGAGGFGVSLAIAAYQNQHQVTVWDISEEIVQAILRDGEHKTKLPGVKIPKGIGFTTDPHCMENSDMVVFVVPSLFIRSVAQRVKPFLTKDTILVNASKGLEEETFLTMSQIIQSEYPENAVGVITGPSHAEEVGRGVPTTVVAASKNEAAAVQIQDAEEELSASATLEHGTISISATETALNIYLSKKLRDFHTEYPGIRLRISNHSTPQAVQAVKNGEVDFAIVSTPAEVEPGLKMVELKSFYEVLVGGKTFTALASQNLSLKELTNYPLISLSDESMTRSFYRQLFLDHDAVLKPDTEAATTDQMLTLVKSELGLAFVPEPMAREPLQRGEIVQLHLQEIIPSRSICLVYDHHRPLNTAARKFQQMITQTTARHAKSEAKS